MNFLILYLIILKINSLMISLNNYNMYCINKQLDSADTIKGSFICSGEKEDLIHVYLKNDNNEILYNNILENKYNFKGEFAIESKKGIYTMCFELKTYFDIIISFDIYTLNETGHIVNLVKDGISLFMIYRYN